jgi:gluconate 2-dehydrogenase gamma chain
MNRVTRRKFIQVASAAAAGSMVCCTNGRSPWRFFTLEEGRTADAICERLIPADQDPGASQVGVVNFLDIQLVGPYKRFRSGYRQGLKGIDKQDAVLKELERGGATGEAWKEISSKDFFALILGHTMQGYYGDPRHGGNRGRASWKMVGLPYPPIRGRLHYDLTSGQMGRWGSCEGGDGTFAFCHLHFEF